MRIRHINNYMLKTSLSQLAAHADDVVSEFELRIVFQMSQEDSLHLVDSPAANKLGPYRALLLNEETGQVEKFRPYGLPAKTWLEQAATDIRRKK